MSKPSPDRRPFETDKPQLSDATIAKIRQAAHQFVRAGGSIFPSVRDDDASSHIANVARLMDSKRAALAENWSDVLQPLNLTDDAIYDRVMQAIIANSDAAFVFGAFVGLETAGLICCGAIDRMQAADKAVPR